jgi:centromeric protein E
MLGDDRSRERGVLEMAAEDIFRNIARAPDRDFLIRVSFVEIYNEKIFDLLSDQSEPPLVNIREDPRKGVYCEATDMGISSYDDILRATRKGTNRRHVAETLMNEKSSRSHTIFRYILYGYSLIIGQSYTDTQ